MINNFSSSRMLLHLACGKVSVLVMPSSIQSRISLWISQVPTPSSFLTEIGGTIFLPVLYGGGNTAVMTWSR